MGRELDRAVMGLKVLAALVVLALVALLVLVYGFYWRGKQHLPADWGPTAAAYPDVARRAYWRSLGGAGEPRTEATSPPEYVWRALVPMLLDDQGAVDHAPDLVLFGRVGRQLLVADSPSGTPRHYVHFAAAVDASGWPTPRLLDTALEGAYFSPGATGYRAGALRVFGRSVYTLDAAQLHLLAVLEHSPSLLSPWCKRERLRHRALEMATKWQAGLSEAQVDAALATVAAPPDDVACRSP